MENKETLEYIISCIEKSGNDPRSQIYGYYTTGNECYITRYGDARKLIKIIDMAVVAEFLSNTCYEQTENRTN